MKNPVSTIDDLFHEKIMLYRDLLDALSQEREIIKQIDVDALWKVSEQKQKIASKIAGVRLKILDGLTEASLPHGMEPETFQAGKILSLLPKDVSDRIQNVNVTLASLKSEVYSMAEENKGLVGDYLAVLDELIGVITDTGSSTSVYDKSRSPERTAANMILHREA